jgi:tricorn protease-like protein
MDPAKYLVASDDSQWRENPDDILLKLGVVQKAWRRSDGKAVALYRATKGQDWTTKDLVLLQQDR